RAEDISLFPLPPHLSPVSFFPLSAPVGLFYPQFSPLVAGTDHLSYRVVRFLTATSPEQAQQPTNTRPSVSNEEKLQRVGLQPIMKVLAAEQLLGA
ncbi:MAG: hypothetical protein AAB403_21000, partial [Planctomycetota bacterium]